MLAEAACLLAALPLGLALDNLRRLRVPEAAAGRPAISVLLPARNEERNIADAVGAILGNTGVEIELIVQDDGSTDRTAEILAGIADPRLRVLTGIPLPAGWSGKQHACARLAQHATHDLMVFVDADVRLAPDALSRMAGFMQRNGGQQGRKTGLGNEFGLASGFPRQITVGFWEKLLLPLIHFLLLGYLPMARMERDRSPGLGAGCGQLFIARRDAYIAAGGHSAIRASMHDGLMLPRAVRRAGFMTGLFDATPLATCRMYETPALLWEGLLKNATEGMAKPVALPVWTILLLGGQVLPFLLLPSPLAILGVSCVYALRALLAARFGQSWLGAALHPLGVLVLVGLQWLALTRQAMGIKATWRGRAYTAQS